MTTEQPGQPSPDAAAQHALRLHARYRGKVQTQLKCPVRSFDDFAVWYTPGVAAPCRAISARCDDVYEYTNKANTVAIVSDGTRVLGLGNIGPEAGLPVMEGKALLFKYLGGVDAVPLCLRSQGVSELVRAVELLEPSFGGINLEDIGQPNCFRVLDRLRSRASIPVWHDDQQGTATVTLAGLVNALNVVGKQLDRVRIALVGIGAANIANYRLLVAAGADPRQFVACDRGGTLHSDRADLQRQQDVFVDKWRVCRETNGDRVIGGLAEALRDADVCLAFSTPGPDAIRPEWIRAMRRDAIVFACANPVPEIWPAAAHSAGARIVATGRCDFPNQVNNSLAFPAVFRGTLDVRARSITDAMARAAADELASSARQQGLREDRILPRMDDQLVTVRVATAVGLKAQEEGVARLMRTAEQLQDIANRMITNARATAACLMNAGLFEEEPVVDRDQP